MLQWRNWIQTFLWTFSFESITMFTFIFSFFMHCFLQFYGLSILGTYFLIDTYYLPPVVPHIPSEHWMNAYKGQVCYFAVWQRLIINCILSQHTPTILNMKINYYFFNCSFLQSAKKLKKWHIQEKGKFVFSLRKWKWRVRIQIVESYLEVVV